MNWSKSMLFASAAVLALSAAAAHAENMPKRIGYVTNYATHEWYQNVIKGMQSRAKELGIELEVRTPIWTLPRRSPPPKISWPRASTS
ncbi:hypothetical protein NKI41_08235 [Mesorhizobium sp. M0601]|uniref:hypothetical protein n=1 Tax=Mesorhizobium sp. M0601 TaxID=2956969 RepID=UPI003336BAA3